MTTRSRTATQLLRHLIQLLAFILIPELFIQVLQAVKDIWLALLGGSFSLASQGASLLVLLAAFPVTVLWGRFFCGWLCAFGSLQEWLSIAARKLHFPQLHFRPATERRLKWIKYAVLVLLIIAWTLGLAVEAFSPLTVFGRYAHPAGWTQLPICSPSAGSC